MKKWGLIILFASIGQLWSQVDESDKKIQGIWTVTWGYFSSTSTPKSDGSAPLGEAIWTFNANGTYTIQSTVYESGKYSVKNSMLYMDADKPITPDFDKKNYMIINLDDEKLEIGIDIMRTESFFMTNYTIFSRKK